ncbi:MAG TPA: TonB-dependent receptor [Terriglobia bacterium]|nr:TonB-dependent receptor [Terriglobia bacterium]
MGRYLKSRIATLFGSIVLGLLFAVSPAYSQTGTGTITGTVSDSTGSVVTEADVTLTDTLTGVSRTAKTSGVGIYYFGAVPIGSYKLAVNKPGFEEWLGTFSLQVGENAVVNATVRVGSPTTTVQVTGAATPIDTTSGTVADVKDSNQIRELPLNGRQIGLLFDLTAGVESGSGGARVNGMKVGSLDINLDGVTQVDRFGGGMVRVQPGIETIQEFRIETVGSDATFDQPATVIMATRSGTNQLHGGGYEYLRDNTVIGPARLRSDPVNVPVPLLIRNEFGAYAGGPIYIPHLYNGRDKSFWFFDYEGLRDHERASPLFQYVPTAAMWSGDLSNAVDPNNPCSQGPSCPTGNSPVTIYNPNTTGPGPTYQRTPFLNNQIPGPLSPTAAALKSLTALPTNTNNPYVAPNFTATYPNVKSTNTFTSKVDENLSDKDRLSVRYTRSWTNAAVEGGYYANPINDSSGMGTSADNYYINNVGVSYTKTISPTWLNELLVGVNRSAVHYGTLADFTDWDSKLSVPNPFGVTGWPTLYSYENQVGTYMGPSLYFGWDSDNVHNQNLTSETIEDNVTWTHGKHTVQFGGRGRREQNNVRENQQAQGSNSWQNSYTTDWCASCQAPALDSGSGFAELLLGLPQYLSNQYNRGYFYFRQTQVGLYGNDKIKVSPRLTLNLGLRWEDWTPYTEAQNRLVEPYNPATVPFEVLTPGNLSLNQIPGLPPAVLQSWEGIGLTSTTANSVGYPSKLFRAVHHDFGPRLGVAYQLGHNTVIRGSYGIYYVGMPLSLLLQSTRSNPPLNLRFQTQPGLNTITTAPGVQSSAYYVKNPTPGNYLPPDTVSIVAQTGPNSPIVPYDNGATVWDGPNWNDERQQTWNFTVEHELPKQIGLRLSYIGTYGQNLEQQYAIDDPEPLYNYAVRTGMTPPSLDYLRRPEPAWSLIGINHTGFSHDNSAQVEIHRRFANGVSFQAFYTYVRGLTTTDPGGFQDGNTSINGGAGSGNFGGSGGATVPENVELLGEPNLTYQQRLRLAYFNNTTIPPHRVTFNGVFDLPFGKGKRFANNISTPLDYVIGGWQVATIGTWNSGLWMGLANNLVQPGNVRIPAGQRATFNISGSSDHYRQWFAGNFNIANATNVTGKLTPAVARLAGPDCEGSDSGHLAVTLADGTCYDAPFNGFYNPAPRDNVIGPGAWNDDLSIYKHFKVKERFDMRFAADFFNALNHPNDIPPSNMTGLQDLSLQQTTSNGGLNDPRVIQLSLRVEF